MAKTLVIGGLGWVGSNTAQALAELGHDCVLTRHANSAVPPFLQGFPDGKVVIEYADATSLEDLRKIGERHPIEGIFCAYRPTSLGSGSAVTTLRSYFDMLTTVFQVAQEWKVKRVTMTSTVGVYLGLGAGPVSEDQMLPLSNSGSAGYQKLVELACGEFTRDTGTSAVCVRIGGMFGPGMNPRMPELLPRLVHAAVKGLSPSLDGLFMGSGAEDAVDRYYVKDMGRAIALVQTVDKLPHAIYNLGSGRAVLNREIVDAIQQVIPSFQVSLPTGRNSRLVMPTLDTSRIRADTGFTPEYTTRSGVADYIEWLRAGNAT
jgi:UDP-glucose 4-epimerase